MQYSYPGEWLPEPVATESADHELHQKDILPYSQMVFGSVAGRYKVNDKKLQTADLE